MARTCSTDIVPVTQCLPATRAGFKPGISTRYIPSCSPTAMECGEALDCGQPAWWVNNSGSLDRTEWLKGWAINQLAGYAAASCEETLGNKAAGGWWADSFRASNQPGSVSSPPFVSGSKLWTLQGKNSTNETMLLAKHYAEEALAYLVTIGLASRIAVTARYLSSRVLGLYITIFLQGVDKPVDVSGTQQMDFSWSWS